jgi:hypothetical protein
LIGNAQWSAPSLEQMAELQQGLVPREYGEEDKLTPQALRIYRTAMSLLALVATTEGAWASARASDGEKGGPNMRGSKGDQMLPSQTVSMVEGFWQTPYGMAGVDASGKLGLGGEFAKQVTRWAEGEWPATVVLDSTSTANLTAGRSNPESKHHSGVTMTDAIRLWSEGQWPTVAARDFRSGEASPEMYTRNARPLNEMVISWFESLTSMADEGMWATTSASVANDGEGPETWRARQAKLVEKGYNGNGAGVPLAIQAQETCLSSRPDLEAFVGWLSRIIGPISSPPSTTTDGSPPAAPSTRSSSRGSALVRLNPAFTMWLMGGITQAYLGHTCRGATAPAPTSCGALATA